MIIHQQKIINWFVGNCSQRRAEVRYKYIKIKEDFCNYTKYVKNIGYYVLNKNVLNKIKSPTTTKLFIKQNYLLNENT